MNDLVQKWSWQQWKLNENRENILRGLLVGPYGSWDPLNDSSRNELCFREMQNGVFRRLCWYQQLRVSIG